MFPLVAGVDDFRRGKDLVDDVRRALDVEGLEHGSLPLGAMVELPAAALQVAALSAEAEFLSVGTNDLVQYTLAADRGDAALAEAATPLHPSILRLLELIIQEASVPVSVCGEMASDPLSMPLLLGLGYRQLSVPPTSLPVVAEVVRRSNIEHLGALAVRCRKEKTTAAVRARIVEALHPSLGGLWAGVSAGLTDASLRSD